MELIIVTGMSGAGKSSAASALEDLGFYCVDNIPPLLMPAFIELTQREENGFNNVAIVTDIRGGELFNDINNVLDSIKKSGINYKILFLDANNDELVRRYSETRRKHPFCEKENITVSRAVIKERALLEKLKEQADYVVDTSKITAGQLKKQIIGIFAEGSTKSLNIQVMSFGYKFGHVNEANLVFDVRCLENPYYIDTLRNLTGLSKEVSEFVMGFEKSQTFAQKMLDFINFAVPLYANEGKSQLVIAVGCTGGKHRSVTFAEIIYKDLLEKGFNVSVTHRDIEKV